MTAEYGPKAELSAELVRAYAATFIPRFDRYPLQLSHGRYIQIEQPLTADVIHAHLTNYRDPLQQVVTLGAYTLNPQSEAKWICFDADKEHQWQQLLAVARNLEENEIPPYLEPSRRGGHLWLFFEPMSGINARRFAMQLLSEYGIEKLEIYPKQSRLLDGAGSFVRLPLGLHRKSGRVYHFVDVAGAPLATTIIEQIRLLGTPKLVPAAFILDVLAGAPEPHEIAPSPTFNPSGEAVGSTLSERIKNGISVYEFVSQYVSLNSQGIGHCPFHSDEHHSFQVAIQGNYWNCYAECGGGSIIDFWMKMREKQGLDPSFKETVTELAKMLL